MSRLCCSLICLALGPLGLACHSAPPPQTPASAEEQAQADAAGAKRLFEQGRAYAAQGNAVRAEQYLGLALERGYSEDAVLPILLEVCLKAGRLRSALTYAEPALRRNPEDFRLRYLASSIYFALGEPNRASEALTHTLRDAPGFAPAHYLQATVAWEAFGDSKEAKAHYLQYLLLEPRGPHTPEVVAWLRTHGSQESEPIADQTAERAAEGAVQ